MNPSDWAIIFRFSPTIIGSCGTLLQEVSLQIIWKWKMLEDANENPTAKYRIETKIARKKLENPLNI